MGILPLEFIVPKYSQLKESNAVWQIKPFYTYAHGYKLSLQVVPNGLGDAKGTHVSVFIYLMKGEFDEDLHWPLRGEMEVYLIDHTLVGLFFADEVTFRFVDEKSDASFSRVTKGEKSKCGWGKLKFISHSSLDIKYLKNDCLHFRIKSVKLH